MAFYSKIAAPASIATNSEPRNATGVPTAPECELEEAPLLLLELPVACAEPGAPLDSVAGTAAR